MTKEKASRDKGEGRALRGFSIEKMAAIATVVTLSVGVVYHVVDDYQTKRRQQKEIIDLQATVQDLNPAQLKIKIEQLEKLADGELTDQNGILAGIQKIRDSSTRVESQIEVLKNELERTARHQENHEDEHEDEVATLARSLAEVKLELTRLDTLASLLLPLLREQYALGRISNEQLRKVYTKEELAEFYEAVEELLRKPGGGGGGGGDGNGGVEYQVANGEFDFSTGDCIEGNSNCIRVTVIQSAYEIDSVVRVEVAYGLNADQMAMILSDSAEGLVRSAEQYDGPLCRWLGQKVERFQEAIG